MNGLSQLMKQLGFARLGAIAVVAGLLAGGFLFLMFQAADAPKGLLYTDLTVPDSARIVERLDQLNVPYEVKGSGTTVYVPQDQVFSLRMQFAQDGLPSGGVVGYELFDNQDALGTTNFMQNLNRVRALEGELSRTVSSLNGVRTARVHLVLPKRDLFSRDTPDPTASITIEAARGQLARSEVQAIQFLVASAVEGLMPGRVSIVDAQGNLLASGAGTGEGALAGSAEERRIALENRIKGQIEQILAGIVRPQGLRVTVNAEMDFNRTVTESQIYDPDRQVIAETSTVEEISNARDSRPGGAVSASEELPDTNGAGTDGEAGTSESSNRTEERTQFRSSLTKTTEVEEGGRLERLSVAVAVDGAREAAEDGTTTWTPRTEEEMAQITALVRTAMGFDRRRGDQLEVTNMRFEAPPVLDAAPVEEPLIQLDKTDYMRIAELAVLAVMALILVLFVFRPILKQLMTRPTEQQAGQQALTSENLPQLAPPAEGQVANQNQPGAIAQTGGGAAQALPGPGGDNDVSRAIDIAQVQGQVKESSIKKVGEIVTHHPEESMAILRSWLHQSS